ncbi:Nudix family hydrolase [Salinisphaera japonica]|uniref:8-oxo-dGTP diphosphatase n=1 Tax=Salinisphaera japonica YTM-1 TaxID=1209778 RepID=A0A423PS71_9GAMM|nr:Nudix family hydrolase [Salinisphaera japonica]ROO28459.1 DNA damage repair protein MutT [Salinisphaera japonica YTM-1]
MDRAPLDIAVGVLVDDHDRLLIARRRADTPGAGYWEFPGGKREPGESVAACLSRELAEEIGVTDLTSRSLIRFSHDRGPRPVRLHVARIDNWTGEPAGQEGQQVRWCAQNDLSDVELLPATNVILAALNLPPLYIITPSIGRGRSARQSWFDALDRALRAHVGDGTKAFVRLRQPGLDDDDYADLAKRVLEHARRQQARVLLDRSVALVERLSADGLHCSTRRAQRMDKRPIADNYWFGVSTHSADELTHAAAINADFATLSPVAATETHSEARPLGWPGFEDARGEAALPVYALGGMRPDDLGAARDHYAQGVAGIRGFWPGS